MGHFKKHYKRSSKIQEHGRRFCWLRNSRWCFLITKSKWTIYSSSDMIYWQQYLQGTTTSLLLRNSQGVPETEDNAVTAKKHLGDVTILLRSSQGVPENEDNAVTAEKHLGDVAIFVNRFWPLLAFSCFGCFCPHLLHILKDHIAMPVEKTNLKKKLSMWSDTKKESWKIALTSHSTKNYRWVRSFHITIFVIQNN